MFQADKTYIERQKIIIFLLRLELHGHTNKLSDLASASPTEKLYTEGITFLEQLFRLEATTDAGFWVQAPTHMQGKIERFFKQCEKDLKIREVQEPLLSLSPITAEEIQEVRAIVNKSYEDLLLHKIEVPAETSTIYQATGGAGAAEEITDLKKEIAGGLSTTIEEQKQEIRTLKKQLAREKKAAQMVANSSDEEEHLNTGLLKEVGNLKSRNTKQDRAIASLKMELQVLQDVDAGAQAARKEAIAAKKKFKAEQDKFKLLTKRFEEIQIEKETVKEKAVQQAEELAVAEAEVKEKKRTIEQQADDLVLLEDAIRESEQAKEAADAEASQANAKLAQAEEEFESTLKETERETTDKFIALKKENQELKATLPSVELQEAADLLEQKNTKLEEALDTEKASVTALTEEAKKANQASSILQGAKKKAETSLSAIRKENGTLHSSMAHLKERLEKTQAELTEQEKRADQSENSRAESDRKLSDALQENTQLNNELTLATQSIQKVTSQLTAVGAKNERLRQQVQEGRERLEKSKTDNATFRKTFHENVANLEGDLKDAQTREAYLQLHFKASENNLVESRSQVASLEVSLGESEKKAALLDDKLKESAKDVKSLREKLSTELADKVKVTGQHMAMLTSHREEMINQQNRYRNLLKSLESTEMALAQEKASSKDLKSSLEKATQETRDLTEKLTTSEQALCTSKDEVEKLKRMAKQEGGKHKLEIEDLVSRNSNLKRGNLALTKNGTELQEQVKAIQKDKKNIQRKLDVAIKAGELSAQHLLQSGVNNSALHQDLEQKIEELKISTASLEKTRQELIESKATNEGLEFKITEEIRAKSAALAERDSSRVEAQEKTRNLQEERSKSHEKEAKLNEVERINEDLNKKNKTLEETLASLKPELTTAKEIVQTLTSEKAQAAEQLASITREKEKSLQQISDLKKEVETKKQKFEQSKLAHSDTQDDLDAAVQKNRELTNENLELQQAHDRLDSAAGKLAEKNGTLLQKQEETLEHMKKLEGELQNSKSHAEQLQQQLEEAQFKNAALTTTIARLEGQLSSADAAIDELTAEKKAALTKTEELEKQLATSQRDNEVIAHELETTKNKLSTITFELDQLKILKEEVDSALKASQKGLEEAEANNTLLSSELSSSKKEVSVLQTQVDTLQGQVNILEENVQQLTSDLTTQHKENQMLTTDISRLTHAARQQEAAIAKLTTEKEEAEAKAASLKQQLTESKGQNTRLADELQSARKLFDALTSELNQLTASKKESDEKLETAQQALGESNRTIAVLTTELQKTQATLQLAQDRIKQLESDYTDIAPSLSGSPPAAAPSSTTPTIIDATVIEPKLSPIKAYLAYVANAAQLMRDATHDDSGQYNGQSDVKNALELKAFFKPSPLGEHENVYTMPDEQFQAILTSLGSPEDKKLFPAAPQTKVLIKDGGTPRTALDEHAIHRLGAENSDIWMSEALSRASLTAGLTRAAGIDPKGVEVTIGFTSVSQAISFPHILGRQMAAMTAIGMTPILNTEELKRTYKEHCKAKGKKENRKAFQSMIQQAMKIAYNAVPPLQEAMDPTRTPAAKPKKLAQPGDQPPTLKFPVAPTPSATIRRPSRNRSELLKAKAKARAKAPSPLPTADVPAAVTFFPQDALVPNAAARADIAPAPADTPLGEFYKTAIAHAKSVTNLGVGQENPNGPLLEYFDSSQSTRKVAIHTMQTAKAEELRKERSQLFAKPPVIKIDLHEKGGKFYPKTTITKAAIARLNDDTQEVWMSEALSRASFTAEHTKRRGHDPRDVSVTIRFTKIDAGLDFSKIVGRQIAAMLSVGIRPKLDYPKLQEAFQVHTNSLIGSNNFKKEFSSAIDQAIRDSIDALNSLNDICQVSSNACKKQADDIRTLKNTQRQRTHCIADLRKDIFEESIKHYKDKSDQRVDRKAQISFKDMMPWSSENALDIQAIITYELAACLLSDATPEIDLESLHRHFLKGNCPGSFASIIEACIGDAGTTAQLHSAHQDPNAFILQLEPLYAQIPTPQSPDVGDAALDATPRTPPFSVRGSARSKKRKPPSAGRKPSRKPGSRGYP